jgi:meso-butanediol dehydrogenase/(S,S)-butanediol dehydrogenase/diacetyl reductase
MPGRLEGKVAVITGTGGGQGRVAALRFAREGARVVGCDVKTEGSEETVEMVRAAGGEMVALQPLDLCDEVEVERLMALAEERFGGIDILYNNAGALRVGGVEDISLEDFEFTMDNEILIVFLAIKHAVPRLRARGGGVIINIGSIAGMVGTGQAGNLTGLFSHCVGKAAVIRMSEVLAVELSPLDIRVNTISPGCIVTPATEPTVGDGTSPMGRAYVESALVDRLGSSEDIVNAAVFLASDEAAFATGSNFLIDGGWVASGGVGRPQARVQELLADIMPAAT